MDVLDEYYQRNPNARGWADRELENERHNVSILMNKQNELIVQMNDVEIKYLKYSLARDHFVSEVISYSSDIDAKINKGEITVTQGIDLLDQEINSLKNQDAIMRNQNIRQVVVVRPSSIDLDRFNKNNKENTINLIISWIGFVSGTLQFIAGVGVASTGAGAAFGGLLMAHGVNNIAENGYYILYRESYTGPLKFIYEGVGGFFGLSKSDSDVLYTLTDLGLSVNGMLGFRLAPDQQRLYRYINADLLWGIKNQGIKGMSGRDIMIEALGDTNTIYGQKRNY